MFESHIAGRPIAAVRPADRYVVAPDGSTVQCQGDSTRDGSSLSFFAKWQYCLFCIFCRMVSGVFRVAGVARKDEAVDSATGWSEDMVGGSRRFRWVEQGPGTAVADPDPDLPCTSRCPGVSNMVLPYS